MLEISNIESCEDFTHVLNTEVIGIDGYSNRKGIVKKITMQDHKVLGKLVQIWIKWDGQENLEAFFPRQFKKYYPNCPIGIYVV